MNQMIYQWGTAITSGMMKKDCTKRHSQRRIEDDFSMTNWLQGANTQDKPWCVSGWRLAGNFLRFPLGRCQNLASTVAPNQYTTRARTVLKERRLFCAGLLMMMLTIIIMLMSSLFFLRLPGALKKMRDYLGIFPNILFFEGSPY